MKTKICTRCKQEKKIWKSMGKDEKYCSTCWNIIKPRVDKPRERRPMVGKYFRSSKQKSIRKVSDKLINLHQMYKILRDRYLKNHPICEAHLPGCSGKSDQVHHKAGRIGKLLLDDTKFLAVDSNCHRIIEMYPEMAISLGFSLPRLKTEDKLPEVSNNPLNQS